MKLKGLSLFANVGIAECYLEEVGIDICVANELLEERAAFYSHLYPTTQMIVGDITKESIYDAVIAVAKKEKVDFLMATPPCQGMSLAGSMKKDDVRNQLIYFAVKAILDIKPQYVFLENVPQQLKTKVFVDGETILIPEYLEKVLSDEYDFAKERLVSARDYGVPQMRKRNIILLSRKDVPVKWEMPEPIGGEITLREALENVPSLDPYLREGMAETLELFPEFLEKKEVAKQVSKWHYPPTHSKKLVELMIHTPSGATAFDNGFYYPQKKDGTKVKGHYNQYRRYSWDKPSRTITQNSAVISSLCCVHPGHPLVESENDREREYSDARCFSIYELLIVSSLPLDWDIPEWASEKLIRSVIGEGIPPMLVKHITQNLMKQIEE